MLGVDVSDDYIKNHLDDIKAASEGSTEAMIRLQQTAASDWGKNFVNELEKVEQKTDKATGEIIQKAFTPDEE
jgi:uncharacterized protein Yka (UPF0111/DUF47 family)